MGRFERRWRAASRRHWAILAVCVALVLIGVRLAVGEHAAPGVVLLPRIARPLATESFLAAAPPALASAAQTQTRVGRPGEVEVCGLGWVVPTADNVVDPAVLARMPGLEDAGRVLMASMASSADEFDRAALVWLRMLEPSLGVEPPSEQPAACEGEACAFSAQTATMSAGFLEQLARAATTTRDPRVYALAFRACRSSQVGSCALVNARRWAQLDTGNGDPWLYVVDEAAARKDVAQVDEALFRLGAASRVDMRYFAIPGAIAQHAEPTDTGRQAANVLAIVSLGGMAALPLPALQAVTRVCRDVDLIDANRRQRCEAAASALAERSDTILYASVGSTMGRRLGWSESRIDATPALSRALTESLPTRAPDPLEWSCKRIESMLARLSRQGVVGETGYAREWIEASGTTFARYAAQEHERRRLDAEAYAIAASAARAAASAARDATASETSTPYSAVPPPAR